MTAMKTYEKGRHGKPVEKIARKDLKRTQALREELAHEFGVVEAPESFHAALDQTFQKLPDELTVVRQPMRVFVHGLATAAMAMAVVFAALLCINAAQPELAESLPGLGPVFQAVNGELQHPEETEVESLPQPTPKVTLDGFFPLPVSDNGVTLISVEQMGEELEVTAEVPYLGRNSYDLLGYNDVRPLGTGARLTLPDGTEKLPYVFSTDDKAVTRLATPDEVSKFEQEAGDGGQNTGVITQELPEDPLRVLWRFSGLQPDQDLSEVVLTIGLYEDLRGSEWTTVGYYFQLPDNGFSCPVVAEFTIDVNSETAKASFQYESEGLIKLTPDECLTMQRNASFTNGWYADVPYIICASSDGNYCWKVVLFGKDKEYRPLRLNCYWLGDLAYSLDSTPAEKMETHSEAFLDEGSGARFAWVDNGIYSESITDPAKTFREYRRVVFAVSNWDIGMDLNEDPYGGYNRLQNGDLRFELQDPETGEILMWDVYETFRSEVQELGRVAWNPEEPVGEEAVESQPEGADPAPKPAPTPGAD